MQGKFLTTNELAHRWNISYKTLSHWRCYGNGPEYHRLGNRVNYRLEDVEKFEMSKRRRSTSDTSDSSSQEQFRSKQRLPKKRG